MGTKLDPVKYKKLLLAERERLEKERRVHMLEEGEGIGELADYDNHPADAASDTYERTKDYALDEGHREMIDQINEALRKIEDGTYGTCDRCGQPISLDRLRAIPYATLCIGCQGKLER